MNTITAPTNSKPPLKMKWKSDFDKSVVLDNFTDRNWTESHNDGFKFELSPILFKFFVCFKRIGMSIGQAFGQFVAYLTLKQVID